MKISFVIPAYNEEERLPRNLASVLAEIERTGADAEVIVVDNASTDRTSEVARAHDAGVLVIFEPKKGITRARQAGLVASNGELIANIDADTIVPQGWLERVLREFERDPELAALSGPQVYYDLSAFHRALERIFYFFGYVSSLVSHKLFGGGAMLQGGNFIVRREYLERIGGFDTSIEFYGEDTDIGRRVGRIGKVKWTFALPIYASGRRLAKEGVFRTGWRYATNFFSTLASGKPATKDYTDIRSV